MQRHVGGPTNNGSSRARHHSTRESSQSDFSHDEDVEENSLLNRKKHRARASLPSAPSPPAPESPLSSTASTAEASAKERLSTTRVLVRVWREWLTKRERISVLLGLVALLVSVAAGLALPSIAGGTLESLVNPDDRSFYRFVLFLSSSVVIYYGFGGVAYLTCAYTAEACVTRARRRVFSSLLDQPVTFFDATPRAEMITKTVQHLDLLRNALGVECPQLLDRLFVVIGSLLIVMILSPRLAAVAGIAAPVIAFTLSFVGERIVYPLERESRLQLDRLIEAADESYANSRAVKGFGMERAVLARFEVPLQARHRADRTVKLAFTLFQAVVYMVSGTAAIGAMAYGRKLVLAKELRAGDLLAFLVYAVNIAVSLANSTRGMALLRDGGEAGGLTMELLDWADAAHSTHVDVDKARFHKQQLNGKVLASSLLPSDPEPELEDIPREIVVENVTFSYPTIDRSGQVLKSFNLTLKRGKVVCLVGPSGGGKTSVLALLQKFYEPDSGRIVVNQRYALSEISPAKWRRWIGFVSQDAMLFGGTIAENIALGLGNAGLDGTRESLAQDTRRAAIAKAADIANVTEFAKRLPLGLNTSIGPRGNLLSGGQRQRVALARAVVRDPPVLLLDEHTSQLDASSEKFVQESLSRLLRGPRLALIVAHRLATARSADEVVVVVEGKVVEVGSHDSLIAMGGVYQGMWNAQQEGNSL